MPTPQDSGEMMTANMSLFNVFEGSLLVFTVIIYSHHYNKTDVCEDVSCVDTEEPTFEFLD